MVENLFTREEIAKTTSDRMEKLINENADLLQQLHEEKRKNKILSEKKFIYKTWDEVPDGIIENFDARVVSETEMKEIMRKNQEAAKSNFYNFHFNYSFEEVE